MGAYGEVLNAVPLEEDHQIDLGATKSAKSSSRSIATDFKKHVNSWKLWRPTYAEVVLSAVACLEVSKY